MKWKYVFSQTSNNNINSLSTSLNPSKENIIIASKRKQTQQTPSRRVVDFSIKASKTTHSWKGRTHTLGTSTFRPPEMTLVSQIFDVSVI